MKRISIFLGLLMLLIINVKAQEKSNFGFYLGCGINWMKIDNNLFYDDGEVSLKTEKIVLYDTIIVNIKPASYLDVNDAKVKPTAGFMVGGFYEYQANKLFGLQFDLMYNQYGYKLTGYVEDEDADGTKRNYDYMAKTKFHDISLAVLAKFHLLNQHLSIDFGVQPSVCVAANKETHKSVGQKNVKYSSGKDYKPFNLSLVGGVTGCLGKHFLIGARYNYGLFDLLFAKSAYYAEDTQEIKYHYSESTVESKTSSVQITIGYKF